MLVVHQQHTLARLRIDETDTTGEAGMAVGDDTLRLSRLELRVAAADKIGELGEPDTTDLETHVCLTFVGAWQIP